MTIQEFIKENKDSFDSYEKRPEWNGYKVYLVWMKAFENSLTGYPQYALEKYEKIRLSTLDETIQIMKITCKDDE